MGNKLKISGIYFYLGMIMLGFGIRAYAVSMPLVNTDAARGYYSFFTGVLLAGWLRDRKVDRAMADGALLAIALAAIASVYVPFALEDGYPYILTFFVFLPLVILCQTSVAHKIFSSPIWGKLSAISFDVYLWHTPMAMGIYVFTKLTGTSFEFASRKNMLLFLLAAELVGALSHVCLEKPLTKRCTRWAVQQGHLPEHSA